MGRRWVGAIVVLLLSVLWTGGDAEATWWLLNLKKTPGTVSGQVQVACGDSKGVLVYLAGRSFIAFTDANGQFILDWVPPGTYVLHVETVDPPAVHEQTITVVSGRDTTVGAVQLAPDFQSDAHHCGACNNHCASGETCQAGTCGGGECAPGFADCDGVATNGCEASLATVQNCGACGNACSNSHGTTSCTAGGTCQPTCSAGFGDCDGVAANGCEASLATVQNCGACGNVCSNSHGTTNCSAAGTCQPTCSAGFGNCDGAAANGCETSLTTSNANCGACGVVCGPGSSCQAGSCGPLACTPGLGDCDLNPGNGCETSLTTNANCGACGVVCGPGLSCQAGSCQ